MPSKSKHLCQTQEQDFCGVGVCRGLVGYKELLLSTHRTDIDKIRKVDDKTSVMIRVGLFRKNSKYSLCLYIPFGYLRCYHSVWN